MMCLCKIGLFFLWCSRFFFRSSYHMQFKWKYDFREYFLVIYFQPKCFVPLPIPPSFRFVHVLPAGTRGVSHMVRHCDWSVRLDGGMADWGLLYLSRGHHTHQSPKSKKKSSSVLSSIFVEYQFCWVEQRTVIKWSLNCSF